MPITAVAWSSPTATCDAASGSHHVALVVQHGNGSTVSKCVSFSGPSLTGQQVLDQSGVEYRTIDFGGLSAAVCQVDGEPVFFPPTCWATTSGSPFWELFVARKGDGWASSNLGVSSLEFKDGDAEGFRYEAQSDQLPPTILGSCPPATPAPTASPKPTSHPTPRATPIAGTSANPTGTPPETLNPGTPSSAPSASPSQPPLGDVAGATASAGPSPGTGTAESPPPTSGSGDGSLALPIAIVAITALAGLAALRRRPGRPGPTR